MNTHREVDNPQSPIFIKEIEFIVKNLLAKKTPGPNDFSNYFYQTFKEEIVPICYGLNCVLFRTYVLKS